ncbi:hypothetical protein ULF88_18475 [Halopseudomonas pachastrellae]|nr:hypothetical protein [Halopseudomonas pachastrellae]
MSKGRTCPADYRLPASAFSAPASLQSDVLYVIGGLYGNRQALDAIERRLAAEPNAAAVFNGDAHWFDCNPAVFSDIEQRLQRHHPLRGNVEPNWHGLATILAVAAPIRSKPTPIPSSAPTVFTTSCSRPSTACPAWPSNWAVALPGWLPRWPESASPLPTETSSRWPAGNATTRNCRAPRASNNWPTGLPSSASACWRAVTPAARLR